MKLKMKMVSIMFFTMCIGVTYTSMQKYGDIEFSDKASVGTGWNFEIQNKFPGQIQVDIKNYGGSNLQISKILKNSANAKKLRIALVNVKNGFTITITELGKNMGAKSIINIFPNDERRTIYLTVAKDDKGIDVYPQRGTFMGISGKTESGLLLNKSKNVQKDDITVNQF